MATNLRLRQEAEVALRTEAARTGKSQQEIIRAAVDRYLGLVPVSTPASPAEALVATGAVLPARTPFRQVQRLTLPDGVTSADLLDRDDFR